MGPYSLHFKGIPTKVKRNSKGKKSFLREEESLPSEILSLKLTFLSLIKMAFKIKTFSSKREER